MARNSHDHAKVVLGGIIPNRLDLLYRVQSQLLPEHFTDPMHRVIYIMLINYLGIASGVMSKEDMLDILGSKKADPGKIANFSELYDELSEIEANESQVVWSVDQLREIKAEKETGEALTEAMEILTKGQDLKGEHIQGPVAAREYLVGRLYEIENELITAEAPEGDVRDEVVEILNDYKERKRLREQNLSVGVHTGLIEIDETLCGAQAGDLILVAGYTGAGKSQFVTNWAWHAAVEQGRNVIFATTETHRDQVRRRIIARHSCHPKFGLEQGLNSKDLKTGHLTEDEERIFEWVVQDLSKSEGMIHIKQIPKDSKLSYLDAEMHRINKARKLDLAVMDYVRLLTSDRKRQSDREEQSNLIVGSKNLGVGFDKGRGIPFITPWQVNRTSWEEAMKCGHYKLTGLAETSEAEKSADGVITLLRTVDTGGNPRQAMIKGQLLKQRDGETLESVMLEVDYATCRWKGYSSGVADTDSIW